MAALEVDSKGKESGIVRRGVPADGEWMYKIELISFPCPWDERSFLTEIWKDPFEVLVETDANGKGRGYLIYHCAGGEAHILSIAVSPDFRRRGIAGRLLKSFHISMIKRGVKEVYLEVRRSNLSALALYASVGYKLIGCRRGYYSDGEDALVMKKILGDSE